MTTHTPLLTDRLRLLTNRQRAARMGGNGMFLQELAIAEIHERLSLVNRPFTDIAVVTGFPDLWAKEFPTATIVADEDTLDLAPETHDLVIHAMSLHWANDPVGQLVQCRRALRPDGHFLACLFGGQTLHELRTCLAEAEVAVTGGMSPHVVPMAEIRDLGGLLQRAGFNLPVADTLEQPVSYPNLHRLIGDLRAMGEGNALAARAKKPLSKKALDRAQGIYRQHFSKPDGAILATFDLIFLSGWAPHPDQPKPLRPGSATHSLTAALEKIAQERND